MPSLPWWPIPRGTSWASRSSDCDSVPRLSRWLQRPSASLAALEEVTVRVPEEAADLPVALDRRSEERGAASHEGLVGHATVGHPNRDRVAHRRRVGRWCERHAGLVVGRSSAVHHADPDTFEVELGGAPAALAVGPGAWRVDVSVAEGI